MGLELFPIDARLTDTLKMTAVFREHCLFSVQNGVLFLLSFILLIALQFGCRLGLLSTFSCLQRGKAHLIFRLPCPVPLLSDKGQRLI